MAPPPPAATTLAPPVVDFLIEREGALASGAGPRAPEELLVREGASWLDVGLYLDPGVLAAAAAAAHRGGVRMLARPVLEGITSAAEGISHFVYLATRAGRLRRRLFEEVRFLEHRFVEPGDRDGFLRELRATYRRGTAEKPDYLASRA